MTRSRMFLFTFALLGALGAAHVAAAEPAGKVYDVKQFGAVGDGKHKDTAALQQALDRAGQGGGTVRVPAGTYLSGALHLHSNMTLQLDEGATLKATEEQADFAAVDSRFEGEEGKTHSSLINGRGLENVTITGQGTFDGSGRIWWQWLRNKDPKLMMPRPRLVELINCKNVRVEGVTLKDSPSWNLHPLYCENVIVQGVTIVAPPDSPNTDGVNPDSSQHVLISGCHIDVGDDCIAIKSGKDADGRRVGKPAAHIVVRDCHMFHGHGGVVVGSETSGGVFDVEVRDCVFEGTDRGVRMKTQRGRGGVVEDIRFHDLTMKNVREAVCITMFYHGKNDGKPQPVDEGTPTMRRVTVSNVTAAGSATAGQFEGLPERRLADITLKNVNIEAKKGFAAHFVQGLHFENVKLQIAGGPVMSTKAVEGTGLPE